MSKIAGGVIGISGGGGGQPIQISTRTDPTLVKTIDLLAQQQLLLTKQVTKQKTGSVFGGSFGGVPLFAWLLGGGALAFFAFRRR